jgi:hypothetical protein
MAKRIAACRACRGNSQRSGFPSLLVFSIGDPICTGAAELRFV